MDVTNYKEVNKGCLKAKFNIVIPEWGQMEIRDCTLFQKGEEQWIGMPGKQYEKDGKQKSFHHIVFSKEMKERLQKAVIEKVRQGFVLKSKEVEYGN